jgi:hypothetical protein
MMLIMGEDYVYVEAGNYMEKSLYRPLAFAVNLKLL